MRKRWVLRTVACVALGGFVALFFLPTVILSSPVKNWILYDVLPAQGIEADIESVQLGWLSPTRLENVSLGPTKKHRLLEAEEIRVNRSLLGALFSGSDLGELTIEHPQVHIWIDEQSSNLRFEELERSLKKKSQSAAESVEPKQSPTPSGDSSAQMFSVQINDAELNVKTAGMAQETNVFRDLDLRSTIQTTGESRLLMIDPGQLIKGATITPELCEAGLKFIVPILANVTWTRGEFSMELDACVIDLDEPRDSLLSGRLTIHGIEAGIKDELIDALATRVSMAIGREQFESIHLADESVVHFQVRERLVWHEGVEIGLPRISDELVVRTSGSVSFEEELDLKIDCPMPLHLIASGPVSRALGGKTLSLSAVGTLESPKILLGEDDFVGNLIGSIASELADEERPVASLLQGIRDAVRGDAENSSEEEQLRNGEARPRQRTPILDRFRQRLRDRR